MVEELLKVSGGDRTRCIGCPPTSGLHGGEDPGRNQLSSARSGPRSAFAAEVFQPAYQRDRAAGVLDQPG
jgi:hypothetical protein